MIMVLDVDGFDYEVLALPEEAEHAGDDDWHYAKIRFEPVGHHEYAAREAWLRLEEDIPARSVLDQYEDDYLVEIFLVSEEVSGDKG